MGKRTIASTTKKIIKLKNRLRKLKYEKRQERKIHLIKLGALFKILDLLNESQEVMLGFLEKYKTLSYSQKQEYFLIGEKVLFERKSETYDDDLENRRRMFYLMIRKAALLEKLKIHLEDSKIILGYLSTFSKLSCEEKKSLEKKGEKLFLKPAIDPIISDEEKLMILKKSILNNVDITYLLKNEFKTTIHSVKKSQFPIIMEKIIKKDKF